MLVQDLGFGQERFAVEVDVLDSLWSMVIVALACQLFALIASLLIASL